MSAIVPLRIPHRERVAQTVVRDDDPAAGVPVEAMGAAGSRQAESAGMERTDKIACSYAAGCVRHRFMATAGVGHSIAPCSGS